MSCYNLDEADVAEQRKRFNLYEAEVRASPSSCASLSCSPSKGSAAHCRATNQPRSCCLDVTAVLLGWARLLGMQSQLPSHCQYPSMLSAQSDDVPVCGRDKAVQRTEQNPLTCVHLLCPQARRMLSKRLPVPAYDMLLKCSHAFNILDARGAVGVTERADCFATMRALAREVTGGAGMPQPTRTPATEPVAAV